MMRRILTLMATVLLTANIHGQGTFEIKDGNFMKDGKSCYIIGGEIHYARVPKGYWRHRI